MRNPSRTLLAISVTLWLAATATAQIQVGQNLSMNLSGAASVGYAASYGDFIGSSHGLNIGGNANLTGSYYSPNFLNFAVTPYYNQSRANSDSGSQFYASGVQSVVNLFSGGNFPGSIGYSFDWNQQGAFGVPGTPNYTTNGTGQGFSIGWGARVPDWPTLNASYQRSTSDYTVIGLQNNGSGLNQAFNLNSSYRWEGFNLSGGFSASNSHAYFPVVTEGGQIESTDNTSKSEFINVTHQLPWHGSVFGNYYHSSYDSTFSSTQNSGSSYIITDGVNFNPTDKLTFGANSSYNNNFLASVYQTIINGGAVIQQVIPNNSSPSLSLNGFTGYHFTNHLSANGTLDYREQWYAGNSDSSKDFTGSMTYWTPLKGGSLSLTGGANASNTTSERGTMVGALAMATYMRNFGAWNTAFAANYNQNAQTAFVGYSSSLYGVTANVGRRLTEKSSISASAGYSRGFLMQEPQYGTTSENFSASFNMPRWGVTANYGKSNGSAFVGSVGLVPTGTIPVNPLDIYFYNSHSYGFGLGATPVRNLTLSGSYARAFSDTVNGVYFQNAATETVVTRVQYHLRQLDFQAGWSKLVQGFSLSGLPPQMTGSYYVGLYRAFNFF